jgi:hypothetical protein
MIGAFPKRDFQMACGFLLIGGLQIVALVLDENQFFWATGLVFSLVCALLYASRSFVADDSWLGRPSSTRENQIYVGVFALGFVLLVLLRPGEFWIFVLALLWLGPLAGALSLHCLTRYRRGH